MRHGREYLAHCSCISPAGGGHDVFTGSLVDVKGFSRKFAAQVDATRAGGVAMLDIVSGFSDRNRWRGAILAAARTARIWESKARRGGGVRQPCYL